MCKRMYLLMVFVVIVMAFPAVSLADGYNGWVSEYEGNSAGTLALWNFNESGIYHKDWDPPRDFAGVLPDNPADGGKRWDAYIYTADANVNYASGGKFGWGLHNSGGEPDDAAVKAYHSQDANSLFPAGADPSLTVECWVKFNTADTTQYFVDKGMGWNGTGGYALYYNDTGELRWHIGDGSSQITIHSNFIPQTDIWYHIAGTWDAATDTSKLFVNGSKIGSTTSPGSVIVDNPGKSFNIADRTEQQHHALDGVIDQVRISNVAYDFVPVVDIIEYTKWSEPYSGFEPNTVALWNFNESGIYHKDWSPPRDYAGVLPDNPNTNGMAWDAYIYTADANVSYAAGGKFGWGLYNSGGEPDDAAVKVYRSQDANSLFPAGSDPSLTVECWVKFNDNTATQYLIDKGMGWNGTSGYALYYHKNGEIRWNVGDGSATKGLDVGFLPRTGVWYHIAGTWDAGTDTSRVFINGVEVGSDSFIGTTIVDNSNKPVMISDRTVATHHALDGVIDQVRISDAAIDFAVGAGYEGAYYGWLSEYQGIHDPQAGDVGLWSFNSETLYTYWGDPWSDEIAGYLSPGASKPAFSGSVRIDSQTVQAGLADFVSGGKFGGCFELDGIDHYSSAMCDIYYSNLMFPQQADPNLSVEMWVNFSNVYENDYGSAIERQYLIDKHMGWNGVDGFALFYQSVGAQGDGELRWHLGDGSDTMYLHSEWDPNAGQWYHIAATWNAQTDTSTIYIDGKAIGSDTWTGASIAGNDQTMTIGDRSQAAHFSFYGKIDQVRISSVAYDYSNLSADIDENYTVDSNDLDEIAGNWLADTREIPNDLVLDDMETYATDANVAEYWDANTLGDSSGTVVLLTTGAHSGSNALQWSYDYNDTDLTMGANHNLISRVDEGDHLDLSLYDTLEIWLKKEAGSTGGNLVLDVAYRTNPGSTTLIDGSPVPEITSGNATAEYPGGIDALPADTWTKWSIDLNNLGMSLDELEFVFGLYLRSDSSAVASDTGVIDIDDIKVTADALECLTPPQADTNDDCKVDFDDFAVLAGEWLMSIN